MGPLKPLVHLASLDLVRGFVAVGRRMSITLAAEDLCVTQSAVSRQIHTLEDMIGHKLFSRGHRSIAFTAEGERLFRVADAAVRDLQDIFGTFRDRRERQPVTVTSSIGVASLWLLPRLSSLQARHPDIDVRMAAHNRVLDLRNEEVDLAIRYCAASSAPKGAVRLFGEYIAPVAHPSLGIQSLDSVQVVRSSVLLEYDELQRPWLQWSEWLAASGLADAKPKTILRFNHYDQIIHAALAGQGIALGRLALIRPLIATGQLVVLSDSVNAVKTEHAYWLIRADDTPSVDAIAVWDWIRSEASNSEGIDPISRTAPSN